MPDKKKKPETIIESVPEQMKTEAMVEALGDRKAPDTED